MDKCDLLFLIGGNPASNHPRLMTTLIRLRERGGRVIVVNPAKELGLRHFRVPSNVKSLLFGSEIASIYVQLAIGGDIALLAGIAKRLVDAEKIDARYIAEATEDFESLRALVEALSWEEIEASSGVSRAEIEAVADEYARSERTVFAWTMGITHHEHGVENVQWITNLALLRGMVGREGAGLLPIRGHSNVQGMGTVGVTPAMTKAAVERFESLGLKAPSFDGHDTMAAMEAAERGELSFGLCLGGNLYGANPDATFAARALGRLDTVVYLSTSMNTGHAHGLGKSTLILPVLVRDEESQGTTQESMFSYVRLSDGGQRRHEGPRSEVEILADLAHRTLPASPVAWSSLADHDEIRRLIARLVPDLESLESIGKTKKEFHIPGRVLHSPAFPTSSGKANFRAHPLPTPVHLGNNQLRLMTVRSEGQFNTVVYEEQDVYRGQERRDVILLNASDIARMGLQIDQRVDASSDTGTMRGILVRPFEIAKGCAMMYYPEANVLVSRTVDQRSKTPAFKSVLVSVEPSTASAADTQTQSELTVQVPSSRSRMKSC